MGSWFYQWPTICVFIIFTCIVTILSLLGLYICRTIGVSYIMCGEHNAVISIFTATISVFLGIILSFIIVNVWNNYNQAQLNADKEAETLYLLYVTVENLPDTEETQALIIEYLNFIIDVDYPALKNGTRATGGSRLFTELEEAIYGYNPTNARENTLYADSIDLLNRAIELRIDRLNSAFVGVYPVIWWVTIIDSILIIIMAWFINCNTSAHYILTGIAAIYVATSLFLVIILSYPFEGYLGLSSDPFVVALEAINSLPID